MRFPAEWEPHAATWVAWPHNPETWPRRLDAAIAEFRALVATLCEFEPVHVLVPDAATANELPPAARPHVVPTDDAWLRDTGPTFVRDDAGLVAIDWTFNSWGGKYPPWDRDDAVASRVAELAGVRRIRSELVTEGGALETDGCGTLIATETSLLDPNRNPALAREDVERILQQLLGITRVLWLSGGIVGDDTNGHVDDIARFVAPGRVVCGRAEPADADYEVLEACRARLIDARDARGHPLELIDLPMPPSIGEDGELLPATHANFYLANGGVLVPAYGEASDATAKDVLQKLFPERRVVGVPCRELVRGFGAVHCLTQQQPAV